jgi:hypothetical protein
MTSAIAATGGAAGAGDSSSDLADVIDTILDKGLVIDAHVAVGVVGIRLLTIDARIVIASVDTYLRFAEAVNRLDLGQSEGKALPDLAGGKAGAIETAGDTLGQLVGGSKQRQRTRSRRDREED